MGCGGSVPKPLATADPPAPGPKSPTGPAPGAAAAAPAAQDKKAAQGAKQESPFAGFSGPPPGSARPRTSIHSKLLPDDEAIARLEGLKTSQPENLAAKHFSKAFWESLPRADQTALLRCVRVGTYHPTSGGPGCYASRPEDYDKLRVFFAPLVADVHGMPEKCGQQHSWEVPTLNFPDIGLPTALVRIGVARNFAAFPLPAAMNRKHRLQLEDLMAETCTQLAQQDMPGGLPFGGRYYSLTPGRPDVMREQDYLGLVKQGVMFKDMNTDPQLMTAGISAEWPHGRGAYISKCRRIFMWINEQDHMRLFVHIPSASSLSEPLSLLQATLAALEGILGKDAFKQSEEFGYVTSSPELVGTGMRASVMVKMPQLLAKCGGDLEAIKDMVAGQPVLLRPGNATSPPALFDRGTPPPPGLSSMASMGCGGAPWDGANAPMSTSPSPIPGPSGKEISTTPGSLKVAPGGANPKARKVLTTSLLPSASLQTRTTGRLTPEGPLSNPFVEFASTTTFGITEVELLQRLYDAISPVTTEEGKLQAVVDEAERKVLDARKEAVEKMKADADAARKAAALAARRREEGKGSEDEAEGSGGEGQGGAEVVGEVKEQGQAEAEARASKGSEGAVDAAEGGDEVGEVGGAGDDVQAERSSRTQGTAADAAAEERGGNPSLAVSAVPSGEMSMAAVEPSAGASAAGGRAGAQEEEEEELEEPLPAPRASGPVVLPPIGAPPPALEIAAAAH